MKLYFYKLNQGYWDKPLHIKMSEIECEEKPSTYRIPIGSNCFHRVLKKDDVGRLLGDYGEDLFLYENDMTKASEIFCNFKEKKLEEAQKKVDKLKSDIEVLKNITN